MDIQIAIEIIDTVGFVQGTIFGILLGVLGVAKGRKHNLLFGLFITIYSLELITSLLSLISDAYLIVKNPIFEVLPFKFYFLSIVLFYLYVKEISYSKITYRDLWLLLPGIFEFIANTYWAINFQDTAQFIDNNTLYEIISLFFSIPFNVFILRKIINIEKENEKVIGNQYSNTKNLSIRWCRYAAYIFMFFLLSFFVAFVFAVFQLVTPIVLELFISVFNTVIIYWVSLKAYEQKITCSIYNNTEQPIEVNNETIGNLSDEFVIIDQIVQEKELYKIDNLTIFALSKYTGLHPRVISNAINRGLQCNFNTYINTYRINCAKKLLSDKGYNHLSIEGIGYKCGFKSKSAFYRAFKKETSVTPNQYKEV